MALARSGWPVLLRITPGRFEAEVRGLVNDLAAFPAEEGPVMDAFTFVDMTTGPAGQPMTLDQRVDEIRGFESFWLVGVTGIEPVTSAV